MKSKLKFCTQTAVSALLLGAMGAAAHAQETMETVVVTGFRASLASALQAKERSNLIIESVTPEDIGKMPDQDVAESLQRLPGVQIDRASGQGTTVRIRGLDYNIILLDGDVFVTGREMYQTGEASGGGNGNEFRNSLEGIPSELIAGVDVYKSPNAALVAGGLGGTVDIRLRNGLDGQEGLTIGGNAKMTYSQNAPKVTPAGAIVASYKVNNSLGFVAALSYDNNSTREFELQAQNRSQWVLAGPITGVDNTAGGVNYIEPELMYLTNRTIERKRLGAYAGVSWNPNEAFQTSLTWFHTFLTTDTRDVSDKLWFHSNSLGLGMAPGGTVDANGVVTEGTFRSNGMETSTLVSKEKNLGDNIQGNLKYDNGGKFRFSAKLAWGKGTSDAQFAQADQERSRYHVDPGNGNYGLPTNGNFANMAGCGGNGGTTSPNPPCVFTYDNANGNYPVVAYLAPYQDILTNPAYGLFKSHWAWGIGSKSEQYSGRADVEYDLIEKVTVSAGIRYASKSVDYTFGRYLLNAYGNGTCSFTDATHTLHGAGCTYAQGGNGQGQLSWEADQTVRGPWTYYQDPGLPNVPVVTFAQAGNYPGVFNLVTVKDFWPQAGLSELLTLDPAQMAKCPSCWLHSMNPNLPMQFFKDPINSFKVNSKVTSGDFMIDIGKPADGFHINTGVRVVHTQLNVYQNQLPANPTYWGTATWNSLPKDYTPVLHAREYTDILPSLNAVVDVAEGQKVRFTAARVMAEQNYWQLGQGFQTYYTRDNCPGGRHNVVTGGCDGFSFDGGSRGNYNLDPYRANQMDLTYEYYFGTQGLLSADIFWKGVDSFVSSTTVSQVVSDDFGGSPGGVTTLENGAGGRIEGVELSAQYAFENGIGFNANYTYAKSSTTNFTDFTSHLPFPGVASNAYTAQVYYENGPFQGRVSYTWKGSSFYGTFAFSSLAGGATKTYGIYNRAYGQMDGQLSYQLFENLGAVFEARNILGSATGRYLQFKNQPMWYDQSGRSFSFGVKFNY